MALVANFLRFAYDHGDLNTWQPLYLRLIKAGGIGGLSCELSNNAGALQLGLGFGGIDNGTLAGFGAIEVTTAGNISLAGVTDGLWHAVEYSVSGTAVTFYVTALAGETDESFMSLTMKGYYDGSKQGYYRIASRRVIGFVFIRAGAVLGRIVNTESGKLGFKGIRILDNPLSSGGSSTVEYIAQITKSYLWDMDTNATITVTMPFAIVGLQVREIRVTVVHDNRVAIYNLETAGKINDLLYDVLTLERTGGGIFDSVSYNDGGIDRGYVTIKWLT